MNDWVLLARLVRPQGRKGEIIADLFTDFPDRFAAQPRVFLVRGDGAMLTAKAPREAIIERHWLHQGRVVFKFAGIDSINDADPLRGLEVVVRPEERVPLEDGAFYIGDLVGCRIIDLALHPPGEIGEVVDVERNIERGPGGAPDLLVVRPVAPRALEEPARDTDAVRPRRGKRSKRALELLIPFAKKYVVAVDVANKRVEMRLPEGLAELNAGAANPGDETG